MIRERAIVAAAGGVRQVVVTERAIVVAGFGGKTMSDYMISNVGSVLLWICFHYIYRA